MDFTIKAYQNLINSLQDAGFFFQSFSEFLQKPQEKVIILRHDVDLLPENSLRFAKIQASLSIKGSYYFRAVPESWDERIIKEIAALGHEVGYHYENLDTILHKLKRSGKSFKDLEKELAESGERRDSDLPVLSSFPSHLSPLISHYLLDQAYADFLENLEKLKKLVEVKTICMHGSPRSKYDNKAIWEKYSYKNLGLLGEPYYDMNFDQVFYLTDTGRRWDGWKSSVRDKVPQQDQWVEEGLVFHSTSDIIKAFNREKRDLETWRLGDLESDERREGSGEPREVSSERREVRSESESERSSSGVESRSSSGVEKRSSSGVESRSSSGVESRSSSGFDKRSSSGVEKRSSSGVEKRSSSGVEMPDQIMFTFHPQRWTDNWFLWAKELVLQNLKNQVKRFLVK